MGEPAQPAGAPESPDLPAACGLPAAWAGRAQWRVLGLADAAPGPDFLATWAAWRADAARSRLLHFIACAAHPASARGLLDAAAHRPVLQPLARQLADQLWGLLPGVHRLSFEGGRVLLTLCLGDAQALLRQQQPVADSVFLQGSTAHPALLKAVARCCRRGTRLAGADLPPAVPDALAACGFVPHPPGQAPGQGPAFHATFDPPWQPRAGQPPLPDATLPEGMAPARCLVIGAGLAGAAVAASLARRGWRVTVLDAASTPAAGASGLPAGLFASHVSPDDSLLSRLSRAGVRLTLQTLADLLPEVRGSDWDDGGVIEHGVDAPIRLAWASGPGLDWSRPASAAELRDNHLPAGASACWHARGGWVRPPRLVQRLLAQPGIAWQGGAAVARLERAGPLWRALDARGDVLAEAELAVVCAGPASGSVAGTALPLQLLRGQIAWGLHADAPPPPPWPERPVNGHGNLVPCVPLAHAGDAPGWVLGSTFERDQSELPPSAADIAAGRADNAARLAQLLPALGQRLAGALHPPPHPRPFPHEKVKEKQPPSQAVQGLSAIKTAEGPPTHTWAAVRCAAPDRLPIVGPVDAAALPGLWTCTAMGARGLTLSLLCGELLAARLHGEPLPLEARLARALSSERLARP